ncbi:hypothetical protein VTN31DRAFT_1554 [Thermomyces dupontii]|uniref:uncharacterized protein n=1 Tax=Talaromyces thermophilus TaxID=28565 RepID=UPI003742517E
MATILKIVLRTGNSKKIIKIQSSAAAPAIDVLNGVRSTEGFGADYSNSWLSCLDYSSNQRNPLQVPSFLQSPWKSVTEDRRLRSG